MMEEKAIMLVMSIS